MLSTKQAVILINKVNNAKESAMIIDFRYRRIIFLYDNENQGLIFSTGNFDKWNSYFSKQYKHFGKNIAVAGDFMLCGTKSKVDEFVFSIVPKGMEPKSLYEIMQESKN